MSAQNGNRPGHGAETSVGKLYATEITRRPTETQDLCPPPDRPPRISRPNCCVYATSWHSLAAAPRSTASSSATSRPSAGSSPPRASFSSLRSSTRKLRSSPRTRPALKRARLLEQATTTTWRYIWEKRPRGLLSENRKKPQSRTSGASKLNRRRAIPDVMQDGAPPQPRPSGRPHLPPPEPGKRLQDMGLTPEQVDPDFKRDAQDRPSTPLGAALDLILKVEP
jgi:hypothetical protein